MTRKEWVQMWIGRAPWVIAGTLFCVGVDALHWFFFEELNAPLREVLETPSIGSIQFLMGLYLTYTISLWFVGRLYEDIPLRVVELSHDDAHTGRVQKTRSNWPEIIFFYPSFGFGVLMVMTASEVSGMRLMDDAPVSEDWQQIAVMGTLGIFFLGLLIKPFMSPLYRSHELRYFMYLVPTVLISEVMLNFSVALWHHYLGAGAGPPPEDPSIGWSMAIGFPLFLLFFASPRFTFMSKNFTWLTLTSGLGLAGYEFWRLIQESPML